MSERIAWTDVEQKKRMRDTNKTVAHTHRITLKPTNIPTCIQKLTDTF